MAAPAVEMRNITKIFTGLYRPMVANDRVDFVVQPGEIHTLVGENGAGKTTLMSILYGLLQPDSGDIYLFGQKVKIPSPQAAIQLGIGMVHQHFMLVPSFTIGENIVLGREPARVTVLDRRRIRQVVGDLSHRYGLEVDPDLPTWDVPVGIQQRVEILKTLYRGARILVLDEPTAVLTPQETDTLFEALRQLSASGTTIVLITHKLAEVMQLADRITVLRDGRVVGEVARSDVDERRLAEMMTGRILTWERLPRARATGQPVLEAVDLHARDDGGLEVLRGVSFSVAAGEIVGIAGVAHNGQEELAEVLTGQRPSTQGRILFADTEVTGRSVRQLRDAGLGHIPDDRYGEGCAKPASLVRNLIMGLHHHAPFSRRGLIDLAAARTQTRQLIHEYDIRTEHEAAPIISLSGGNVQKAIVAREIRCANRCLVAEQPSRGIDIGAAEFIYERLRCLREQGVAILLFSTDLAEILRLSDRVLVIFRGRMIGEVRPDETTPKELGLLMAGIAPAQERG